MNNTNFAGPVLMSGEIADAIILAIKRLNRCVNIQDRGAYLRVSVPGQCVLSQKIIEVTLGRPFIFPNDLEKVLLSSQGKLAIYAQKAVWKTATEVN